MGQDRPPFRQSDSRNRLLHAGSSCSTEQLRILSDIRFSPSWKSCPSCFMALFLSAILLMASPVWAQKAPEMGYVYPSGARAGSKVNIVLGGYDWTPDMQLFVHDSRVKVEFTGSPSEIFVPPPPYWFGSRAYNTALPLPREFPARITLPAGLPPGPVRWQAANANGSTATGVFLITAPTDGEEIQENAHARGPQKLAAIPATINGRLLRNEEVDRYQFTALRDGPITLALTARRIGSNFNAQLEVRDASGNLIADGADTTGNDLALTFAAKAGTVYFASLHDVDFRGDRAYVYRMGIYPGPRIVGALPAAGRLGEKRTVEFLVDTGGPAPERVTHEVTFPATVGAFSLALDTPFGAARHFHLFASDHPEAVAATNESNSLTVPGAVSGLLDPIHAQARFQVSGKKGEVWRIAAEARALGSPLDLSVAVLGPDGKERASSDDLPGTTDAGLNFALPEDGTFTVMVANTAAWEARRPGTYRLTIDHPRDGFELTAPQQVAVPLGGSFDLVVKAARSGAFRGPISLSLTGLPAGVTAPVTLEIPASASELKIPLKCGADAAVNASLIHIEGNAQIGSSAVKCVANSRGAGNLCPLTPEENDVSSSLLAITMKPVCKVEPVDKDGGRRIHRGATYPAPVIVTRENGFDGDVLLWMSAHQSYTCMGISGPETTVPKGTTHTSYPCFMPEWLETARTSRMITVAVARVPDPHGNVRYLMTLMDGRITMSMEGALLKITHTPAERMAHPGDPIAIPVKVARSPELMLPVRVELILPEEWAGLAKAEPVTLPPGQDDGTVTIKTTPSAELAGDQMLTLRATAMQPGNLAVISETQVPIRFIVKQ